MGELDWKWRQVGSGPVPKGIRVVLKMADAKDDITYALGVTNSTGNFEITAREDEKGRLPVYWMALP